MKFTPNSQAQGRDPPDIRRRHLLCLCTRGCARNFHKIALHARQARYSTLGIETGLLWVSDRSRLLQRSFAHLVLAWRDAALHDVGGNAMAVVL